jgi:hypothetical protein
MGSVRPGESFADEVLNDAMAEILRRKTPGERLEIAFRLWKFAQGMVRESLRRDHPEWDEAEIQRQVAARMSHGAI